MAMLGVQLFLLPGRWHALEGSDDEGVLDGGVVKDDVATSL